MKWWGKSFYLETSRSRCFVIFWWWTGRYPSCVGHGTHCNTQPEVRKQKNCDPSQHIEVTLFVNLDVKWYMRSRVQTPLKSWLFQSSVRNCLNCVQNCDDHGLLDFKSEVQYMKHFIYHFTSILHGLIRTHKWPAANVSGFIAQLTMLKDKKICWQ